MVTTVVLLTDGDIRDIKLNIKASHISLDITKIINDKFVKQYLSNLGKNKIQLLDKWVIEDTKSEKTRKIELPSDSSENQLSSVFL